MKSNFDKRYQLFDQLFAHQYFYDHTGQQYQAELKVIDSITTIPDYIEQSIALIKSERLDFQKLQQQKLIDYNAPFIITPDGKAFTEDSHYETAVIFIHGTVDSPYMSYDIANRFAQHGCLAFAPLLPGSGTIPGVQWCTMGEMYMTLIQQAIDRISKHADKIILAGTSLGGLLSVLNAQRDPKIKGLVLVSPALKVASKTFYLFHLQRYLCNVILGQKFRFKYPLIHPARYLSSSYKIDNELFLLSLQLKQHQQTLLTKPLCIILSNEDELLDVNHIIKTVVSNQHPASRILLYQAGAHSSSKYENKLTLRDSSSREYSVIDSSHISLGNHPENPVYGHDNPYPLFGHYRFQLSNEILKKPARLGSPCKNNLDKYFLQRITFNPDFDFMSDYILKFLDDVISDA